MKHQVCILLLAIVFVACKKDRKPAQEETEAITPQQYADTIKPESYFPVYPGSWFKYAINESFVFTHTVSATYMPLPVNSNTTSYVPFYNGVPVRGYKFVRYPSYNNSTEPIDGVLQFLSRAPGSYSVLISGSGCDWHVISRWGYCERRYFTKIQKTINAAGDSVIIATTQLNRVHQNGEATWGHTYTEYTKNVGLTYYYNADDYTYKNGAYVQEPDTLETWRLIDYHIGPH